MAEQQPGNNGKKKKAFMIVGVVVAIGLVAGYFYSGYRKTHVSTDDAFIDGNIHTIAAKIYGTVKEIYVTDNQPVKQGDLLLEIDPADYIVRYREASSAVNAEKAKLAEAGTKIAAAQANLELQRANLKLAEIEKARSENLFQKEAIPRDRYDRAETGYEVAVAQVKAAEEQLRTAESQKRRRRRRSNRRRPRRPWPISIISIRKSMLLPTAMSRKSRCRSGTRYSRDNH
jgi:membrane fusion protein (multidrug efflux system)